MWGAEHMDLFDAIFQRRSVRKYAEQSLTLIALQDVMALVHDAERLDGHIPLEVHLIADGPRLQRIMSGVIGSYGKIRAPHYLVLTSAPNTGYLENAGYLLENIALRMTALGIATCWIGGHIRHELLHDLIEIPPGQVPVVVLGFGYPAAGIELYRPPEQAHRKSLRDLVVAGQPDNTTRALLEAVRLAPSSGNSQPWRFAITPSAVHLYVEQATNTVLRHLFEQINHVDMGIALCHLRIAARHLGIMDQLLQLPNTERTHLAYVGSLAV